MELVPHFAVLHFQSTLQRLFSCVGQIGLHVLVLHHDQKRYINFENQLLFKLKRKLPSYEYVISVAEKSSTSCYYVNDDNVKICCYFITDRQQQPCHR